MNLYKISLPPGSVLSKNFLKRSIFKLAQVLFLNLIYVMRFSPSKQLHITITSRHIWGTNVAQRLQAQKT